MTPTVYVVQDSKGKNILPAKTYGKLKILLTPSDTNGDPKALVAKLTQQLKDVQPYDYILPIGDPVAIGLAIHLALHFTHGMITILKWDRYTYEYNKERIEVIL